MKLFVAFALIFWLICGFAGAWLLEGLDDLHAKTIAMGPISLVHGFKENPWTRTDDDGLAA